jgi:hypothetical protein
LQNLGISGINSTTKVLRGDAVRALRLEGTPPTFLAAHKGAVTMNHIAGVACFALLGARVVRRSVCKTSMDWRGVGCEGQLKDAALADLRREGVLY